MGVRSTGAKLTHPAACTCSARAQGTWAGRSVRELLRGINLKELSETLRQALKESKSKQKTETYIKRLRIIDVRVHVKGDGGVERDILALKL